MRSIASGILAGICATVVLSALMVLKSMTGFLPELDIINMLAAIVAGGPTIGWILHFAVGAFWGIAFSVVHDFLPGGNAVVEGIVFGLIAWLMMMLLLMPMAGGGVFGLMIGVMAPIMTGMLHIVFGAVMGWTYQRLTLNDVLSND
tara:strand:+ start:280 stop:717 length:438 start_codon:yes stop_codon:yes gene_type:complete